jgi:hypothetical protein
MDRASFREMLIRVFEKDGKDYHQMSDLGRKVTNALYKVNISQGRIPKRFVEYDGCIFVFNQKGSAVFNIERLEYK